MANSKTEGEGTEEAGNVVGREEKKLLGDEEIAERWTRNEDKHVEVRRLSLNSRVDPSSEPGTSAN